VIAVEMITEEQIQRKSIQSSVCRL